jgi:transcriptional regulator with XRE-family HTH domain
VPEVRSPRVRRRELGGKLRALRQEQGMTVEQVAVQLLCSPSKVSRMETGQRGATLRDVRDLAGIYGVTDEIQIARLMDLAREGKQQGWWQSYDLLEFFVSYVDLEAGAEAVKYYQTSIVPGLLQTAEYAQAMLDVAVPKPTSEQTVERLEVKLKRQLRLTQEPVLRVWALLDEAVLHRVVGGPAVMAKQLDKLVELASKPNVTIQVIAYDAGAHPAMGSTFNILDFAASAPSVVYVEGLVGGIYLDRPQDIDRYQQVFELLLAQALSPQESTELIAKMSEIYKR